MLFNLAFTAAILSVIPIILSAPLHQILPETRSLNTVRSKSNAPSLVPRSTYDRRWNINNPEGPVRWSGSAGSKRASGKDSSGSSSSSSDSSSVT